MRSKIILLLVVFVILAIPVTGAGAQEPYLPLPWGWGPEGLVILGPGHPDYGDIQLEYNIGYPCNEVLEMHKYGGQSYWPAFDLKLSQPVPSSDLRLRFAYAEAWYPAVRVHIVTYNPTGQIVADQTWWASEFPQLGYPYESSWKLVDVVIPAYTEPGGKVRINLEGTLYALENYAWFAGMYVSDRTYGFPDLLCGQSAPTVTPTWTPPPTWTHTPEASPTGTPPTPTATFTPGATVTPGATPTATYTPFPYVTRPPSPSPTPWQTPMATLYPTPTGPPALPTFAPWPTVGWPTVVTRTPFPTLQWEKLTTTPQPTATPYTPTVPYTYIIPSVIGLTSQVDFNQVYSATADLVGTITYPVRVLRGTVRAYMPGLAVAVDAVLIMLFIVLVVYVIKFTLAAIGLVVKLVEVILEFIPL